MANTAKSDSYATEAVIIAGATTCITHVLITLLYFWLLLDTVGRHHAYGVAQNSDLLTASLWSLAATVVSSTVITVVGSRAKYFWPSWLVIPIASTFAFIFSLAIYLHWLHVRSYSPTDPFMAAPPQFTEVLPSALWTSSFLSAPTVAAVYVVYARWAGRNRGTKFQITS